MIRSGITLDAGMASRMVKGHDQNGAVVPNWDLPTLAGAGALRSNMVDMFAFLDANVGDASSDLERSMRDSHTPQADAGPGGRIGLNWIIREAGESSIVWHNGGTGGFRTFMGFDPAAGVGAVVLTNSGHGADDIGFHVINPALPLAPPAAPAPRAPTPDEVEVATEVLQDYVGDYQLAPEMIATFTVENGQLFTQLTGQQRFPLFASSETEFFLKVVEADLRFERDASGQVVRVILNQNGQAMPANKIR